MVNTEPSGCGTKAAGNRLFAGIVTGVCTEPLLVQFVSTQFTMTVPVGVTTQDCDAVPPGAFAVAVKLLAILDCAAVGVHVMVLPFNTAPAGAVVSRKLTDMPDACN